MSHDDYDDEGAPKRRGEGPKGILQEGLRKAIQSGASALFASEEGSKKPLGELRLPKEAIQFLYHQAERGRKDLFRAARSELRRVLGTMDMRGELRRALVGIKVRVNAEVTFEEADTQVTVHSAVGNGPPKPGAPGPQAKAPAGDAPAGPAGAQPATGAVKGGPEGKRSRRPTKG